MSGWKDITSYSRSETDRTPRSFERRIGTLRLIVTRHRDLYAEQWRVSLQGVFERDTAAGLTADAAKAFCESLVRGPCVDALKELKP